MKSILVVVGLFIAVNAKADKTTVAFNWFERQE